MRLPRTLDPTEIRVLGSLLEKQQTTPEYYPLTLGALTAACNQKSNREPVLELTETEILLALEAMRELVLVWKVTGFRADKWEENLTAKLGLDGAAKAILTLLFLRGPQTPGEVKGRSDRMHPFASLAEVDSALSAMAEGKDPLVAELPRRPGQKETRWVHLLAGEAAVSAVPGPSTGASPPSSHSPTAPAQGQPLAERVARLEEKLERLSAEFSELKSKLEGP
jgi:uncharacterized protein YceH (UPF0502 family)